MAVARYAVLVAVLGLLSVAPIAAQAPAADPDANFLRPGDALRLRIWREPDMSGEFPVDERGNVTLARLGAVHIVDVPPDSIQPRLARAYDVYLDNPAIEVVILRRISILGAVLKSGLYPVDPSMTVADALALAGGPAPDGRRDYVELRRNGQIVEGRVTLGSLLAQVRLRSGDQLYVPQRGWVSRNPWLVSSVVGSALTITALLLTR